MGMSRSVIRFGKQWGAGYSLGCGWEGDWHFFEVLVVNNRRQQVWSLEEAGSAYGGWALNELKIIIIIIIMYKLTSVISTKTSELLPKPLLIHSANSKFTPIKSFNSM